MMEVLANIIRNDNQVQGVKIGNMVSLLSVFADDLDIFIQNNERNWNAVQEVKELVD